MFHGVGQRDGKGADTAGFEVENRRTEEILTWKAKSSDRTVHVWLRDNGAVNPLKICL